LEKKRISVAGTGYVGLSTAVGFAGKGYSVITSTHERDKASLVNRGIPPFYEPGLAESLAQSVKNGNLKCVVGREEAILNTDLTFLAVGTPSKSDGSIELQFIESSAKEIGEALAKKNSYHLVVVKSTVVPGTTENVVQPALEKSSVSSFAISSSAGMNFLIFAAALVLFFLLLFGSMAILSFLMYDLSKPTILLLCMLQIM